MSDLLTLQDSLLPSRTIRIAASILCGVLAGLLASPVSGLTVALAILVVTIVGWIAASRWKTRHGLRTNSYYPMTAKNPSAPWILSWGSTWHVVGITVLFYAALNIGTAIESTMIGWMWSALCACAATMALLVWTIKRSQAPLGHIPLRSLLRPDTPPPHSDADRVGTILYASLAVPHGRQITYASLISAIQNCAMCRDIDTAGIDTALAELSAQGFAAAIIERDSSGRPINWNSLTEDGANHVAALLQAS